MTATGTGTRGAMNPFPTGDFSRTGGAGKRTGIGKDTEPGGSRTTNPDRGNRCRTSDIRGKRRISRGLRFSYISSRYESNRDNTGSLRNVSSTDKSIPSLVLHSLGVSLSNRSLMESLSEGAKDMEGRSKEHKKSRLGTDNVGDVVV